MIWLVLTIVVSSITFGSAPFYRWLFNKLKGKIRSIEDYSPALSVNYKTYYEKVDSEILNKFPRSEYGMLARKKKKLQEELDDLKKEIESEEKEK